MTVIVTNPKERNRFFRFAAVGVFGAIVDFGVMNLLYHSFYLPLVIAGTVSFICAILNNFLWNRYWTYPDSRSKPIIRQLIEFSIVSITGLIIRVPILKFVAPIMDKVVSWLPLKLPFISTETLSANLTLSIAIIVVMFWNFFVNRYWTYGDIS